MRKNTQQGFSPDGGDFVVHCSQCDLPSLSLESKDESMAYICLKAGNKIISILKASKIVHFEEHMKL